jgi:glycosyltransferase involved in cell wall biosynthesis
VPHEEALREIESADVCVLPLTDTVENYNYTLPIKLFEYLALGRPTVASNLVGVRQVITDRENGILIRPDDADAMAKAVTELARDPDLKQRLEQNARASIEQYDWTRVHERVLAAYDGFE